MKKIIYVLTIASIAFVSCKKGEDASSKINSENVTSSDSSVAEAAVSDSGMGNNTQEVSKDGAPIATFKKAEHDFGTVKKGSKNETEFEVTNTGNADLVIINASASCGCTVPDYQKTPIKPGESSKIKVVFSANSPGMQSKTVTLTTNTSNSTELLTVSANVVE